MPRAYDWKYRLAHAFSRADLGAVPLIDALRLLEQAVPDYPAHRFDASGCDRDGVRWFEAPQMAIAFAVWAATHQPYDPRWRVVDVVGELTLNQSGLWSTWLRRPLQRRHGARRMHS